MEKKDQPIVVTETYPCTIQKVWSAITDIHEMKLWFFAELEAFEARVGFYTDFVVSVEDRTFTHQFTIIEAVEQERIVHQWQFAEYPGTAHVTFALSRDGEHSVLRLTSAVIDPFPTNIPEFERESGVAGWNYFIKERLKNYLDKN